MSTAVFASHIRAVAVLRVGGGYRATQAACCACLPRWQAVPYVPVGDDALKARPHCFAR